MTENRWSPADLERADAELDALLARASAAPAPAFDARVMARIADVERARAIAAAPAVPALPWWARAATQPATVLALGLMALVTWQGSALVAGAAALLRSIPAAGGAAASPGWGNPTVLTAVAFGFAPVLVVGARLLYEWTARVASTPRARA